MKATALATVVFCAVGAAAAPDAIAHDFWIHPGAFHVPAGKETPVRLFVGTRGDITEFPYRSRFSERFEIWGPGASSLEPADEHSRPAAAMQAESAGIYTVVLQSSHAFIQLPAEKFERYLREEGLSGAIADRARTGQTGRPGLESYFRNCKALVRVGGARDGFDTRVGLPLEITALTNPFAATAGDTLEFEVAFEGKPLAGVHVELMSLPRLDRARGATTDRRGRVRLQLPAAGQWVVAATHMRRAPAGVSGDWESLWSSLSFEVPRALPGSSRAGSR